MQKQTERTKNFKFKKFSIYGGLSGMPVSTDGVLLGAWFHCPQEKSHVLDIGTGTGLLSLMCAQRFPASMITAIEIDAGAVKAANINFEASHWSDRIELLHQNILEFSPGKKFDCIVCNPPYFLSGEQSQNQQRATARHADSLDHQKLLTKCLELLTVTGNASFILPVTEGEQFIEVAKKQGWYLTSLCAVKSTETKETNRMLIELSPTKRPLSETEITIRNSEGYTDSFVELTKSFYLKM
ncbi:methyltransferase [Vibrio hannami]|uniref:tRNA1(Val) (adenine(37)-N6)-methyltransferase n=1 Tax=Vibrio hannami TaxID=2717094 RepID=UPI0024106504|nr:methyltransferase [Vibrio hannami]MDG3089025.1 methyltransferase [Vibrio hannami]